MAIVEDAVVRREKARPKHHVSVALFDWGEQPRIVIRVVLEVRIQNDNHGQTELCGIAVTLVDVLVVVFVHVHKHHDVCVLKPGGDFFITLAQLVKLMAPDAPVGAKLQQDAFAPLFRESDCRRNLNYTIG